MSKRKPIRDELEDGAEPLHIRVGRIRRLLRVSECAEILACSVRQAYLMIETGVLPSIKYAGSVRVDPHSLAQWLREHTAPSQHKPL
jgi:excisionase family DNA binding protein